MRLRTGIDCCKKIRVVSMIDFRQEADGRDVASEGRKLERRTSRAQQRREPSRMNECPRGDLGGKRKRGEEEKEREERKRAGDPGQSGRFVHIIIIIDGSIASCIQTE